LAYLPCADFQIKFFSYVAGSGALTVQQKELVACKKYQSSSFERFPQRSFEGDQLTWQTRVVSLCETLSLF